MTPINGYPSTITLPSYHLPSFYKLWALWDNNNNQFWTNAAAASRNFFNNTANNATALTPETAQFDGSSSDKFGYNSHRTIQNVVMDYYWWG